jgi:uncharacterized protein (DUF1015 family)
VSAPAIRPFRGLRYDPRVVRPADVVSPPYDVIDERERRRLLGRSPRNVVRLILPEPGREDDVRDLLAEWRREGVLALDREPCLYAVEQHYTGPDGVARRRDGLIALVRLEPFGSGAVLPHERTRAAPKEGRLRLLRAARAQLSPVFSLYRDPTGDVARALADGRRGEPEVDVTDSDGTRHVLWRVAAGHDEVAAAIAAAPLLIADGHHRYETALAYQAEQGASGDDPAAWTLMYLANASGDGLTIFPTHRVIAGVDPATRANLAPALAEQGLEVVSLDGGIATLEAALASAGRCGAVGIWLGDGQPALVAVASEPGLDAVLVQERVLGPILGLPPDEVVRTDRITYVHRAADAADLVAAGAGDLALIVRAPAVEDVAALAAAGETMPQKSTYFYPKMLDGLVFYALDDA